MQQIPRYIGIAYGALLLWIGLAWANSIGGAPVFDDHWLVVQNNCFRTLDGIARTLSFDTNDPCAYRPTRYFSYGVDVFLLGDSHRSHHIGNIARHMVGALLAGWLATGLLADGRGLRRADGRALWGGLAVAALWALHPVQTDSVSYVSGRRDILVGVWSLATLGLGRVAVVRGGLWWLAPLWALLIAFLSKENAVVVPALFLFWLVRDRPVGEILRTYRAAFVAALVGLVLAAAMVVQRGILASNSHRELFEWWGGSIISNFATVAALQLRYLRHVFTGGPLIGDYHADTIPLAAGFGDPRALAGALAVAGLAALVVLLRRKLPVVAFGVAFYLVALLPMSHIIPHHELYAEHYLYLPLFGAMLALVGLADALGQRWAGGDAARTRRAVFASALTAGLFCTASSVAIMVRNPDWATERAFYEQVLRQAPQNQRAQGNLLFIYADTGALREALAICGALAPRWIAGSTQERQALLRCTEVASALGEAAARHRLATLLTERHPEQALGWRHLAEVELVRGAFAPAHAAAVQWWERTRSPDAIFVAAQAASSSPEIGVDAVLELLAMADGTVGLAPGAEVQLALALARRGQAASALERLSRIPPEQQDAAVTEMMCQLGLAAGVAELPAGCAR